MLNDFDKLNLEQVLDPIENSIVGENIKFTEEYLYIKKSINHKQIIYDNKEEKKVHVIDWKDIFSKSFNIITTKSKDLSVLFYIFISSIHIYSVKDFLDNIYIIGDFIDKFYVDFFPLKKIERQNFINWFFKKIILELKNKGIIINNKIKISEYNNIKFLNDTCINLQSILNKYGLVSDYFEDFYNIVSSSKSKKEMTKNIIDNDEVEKKSFTYDNSLCEKENFYESTIKIDVFNLDSAYDAINKIQKYIEVHQPRSITPLLIDVLNKFKNYETVDIIKTQEEGSPLNLIAKLINFI